MKRLLSAALLATIFHTALLGIDIGWFTDDTIILPKSTAVTITMSYCRPEPEPEVKKEPIKRKENKPRETAKIPDKPAPPPAEEAVAIPDEPEAPPSEEKTEIIETDESENELSDIREPLEESQGEAVSNMQIEQEAFPLYKTNPIPKYPRLARRRGCQGTVVLSVFVNENGYVTNLWMFTSSGYRLLDNAAVKAVRNWAFEPGKKGNKKVAMWVKVPIRFRLK